MSCRLCNIDDPERPLETPLGFPECFLRRWSDPFSGGQIEFCEACLLYLAARLYEPRIVVEVGTNTGRGTTYFIAAGLHDNGAGELHTIECSRTYLEEATQRYASGESLPTAKVHFYLGKALEVLPTMPDPDMLMIDGGAGEALQEIQLMEPRMLPGSIIAVHDWCTEKVAEAREHLEASPKWKQTALVGLPERSMQYRSGRVNEYTGIGILEKRW